MISSNSIFCFKENRSIQKTTMPRNSRKPSKSTEPRKEERKEDRKEERNSRNDHDEGTRWRGESTNYKGLPSNAPDGKKHRAPQVPQEEHSHHHHSFESGCRDFETYLCFEQELISAPRPANAKDDDEENFIPRPREETPNPRIVGKALFHFARDLSRMYYKIFVYCQSPDGSTNPNTGVTYAQLCAGSSSENGPVVAVLAKIDTTPQPVGKNGQGIQTKGEMSNSDIQNVTSSGGYLYNSVASVYDGILRGDIYLNILGNKDTPGQVTYDQGLIRGQIFHT